MTSTESYTAVATKAREATEKSVESWKQGAKTFTDQANVVAKMPAVDLTQPVARYFDFVQKSVDLNRDLATRWAELVSSMTGTVREQAEKVSSIVKDQTDRAADVATESAHKAEELAQEQADLAEKAEKEQERLARQAERAAAKEAKAKAREPYEELTKAELSDQLAERGLPKSGNVEELIERLVSADSE
jgi:uncharacterized phage infection (PIP) family protein YhgE